jgi:hypothetical protein
VVAGRPHESKSAAPRCLDRGPGSEQCRFTGRRACRRVEVEPGVVANCKNAVYMYSRVTPKHFFERGRPAFVPVSELLQQQRQPLGNLGVMPGWMQARERWMGDDVDR